MQTENRGKAIIKGSIIYAIGNFGTKILSFLIIPLYTYFIDPEAMGDYDLILTTVSLLAPIITLRISDAAYRWMLHNLADKKDCIRTTYRVVLMTSVISFIVLFSINQFIPINFIGYFISILIIGRWMESLQLLLRGLKKQILFAASGILHTICFLSLNLLFILGFHIGVEALFLSTLISETIVCIFIIICEKELRVNPFSKKNDASLLKEMIGYSLPLIPSGISWWVMSASDRYVIRFLIDKAAVGIYGVANKFPTIVSTLFVIFNYSWTDVAIGGLKEGKETSDYSSKLFKQLYTLSFSFLLFLIPITKIITTTILADKYKEAAAYIGFLYLGAVFQGLTTFISAGILQKSNTKIIARSSTIGAIVNLIVDLLAMKYIGMHAASVSTFLGGFVMWCCRMKDLKTVSPIQVNKSWFLLLLFASIIMSLISIWSTNLFNIIMTVIFGFLFVLMNYKLLYSMIDKFKSKRIK